RQPRAYRRTSTPPCSLRSASLLSSSYGISSRSLTLWTARRQFNLSVRASKRVFRDDAAVDLRNLKTDLSAVDAGACAAVDREANVEFPQDREEKRRALLRAVENVRGVLEAHADEAEEMRTLPAASVAALRDSGLLALKLPAVLGGAEADPMTQFEVFEAASYIDPSAGWCLFIGAASAGMPAAFLPDSAIAKIFAGGRIPNFAASLTPGATMVPVEGGYRLSGRCSWASGIRQSDYISMRGEVVREGRGCPREFRVCVVPVKDGQIHDNWHVMGLKGTGSCDFSVTDLFVPQDFTHDAMAKPVRGGPMYGLTFLGYVAPEAPAFALGVARRALDEVIALARSKARGYTKSVPLAG